MGMGSAVELGYGVLVGIRDLKNIVDILCEILATKIADLGDASAVAASSDDIIDQLIEQWENHEGDLYYLNQHLKTLVEDTDLVIRSDEDNTIFIGYKLSDWSHEVYEYGSHYFTIDKKLLRSGHRVLFKTMNVS